ncbi:hypothetical protein [Paenibacillus jiagnxiensis]|uniref:hypothetical protein n=1 Tax=Paenibacillus jiagnxiensis TaxID=3228926 RepID=UPI0033A8026F
MSDNLGLISIDEICRKIMKGTVLDIYYLIQEHEYVFKSEIMRRFVEFDGDPDAKENKYRFLVQEGIAKLEGALFVDSLRSGQKDCYYLTPYGLQARDIVAELIERTPAILFDSKITKAIMEQGEIVNGTGEN